MVAAMPTLIVWNYDGGKEGSPEAARRGEQLAFPGDTVGAWRCFLYLLCSRQCRP